MSSNVKFQNNVHNAAKLFNSLRHLDYSNVSAIADIIDNSIDADASQIWVNIYSGDDNIIKEIEIIDNGIGMDKEILDEALKLGSETEKNPACDLGLYGMGLVTASISMGKRLEVTTKSRNETCMLSIQDIDEIEDSNRFIKILEEANEKDSKAFETKIFALQKKYPIVERHEKKSPVSKTGTIVKISKLDSIDWKTVKGLEGKLHTTFGQTFRKFIKSATNRIYVNGKEVVSIDPIYDFKHDILFEGEVKLPDGNIKLVLSEIEDFGQQINREKKINIPNQGFYIIRNNREIASGKSLDLFTKHNDFNTFRAEFIYPATLDKILNTNFSKQRIQLTQQVFDKVSILCNPFIKQVRNKAKERQKTKKKSNEDFTEIEKYITQKSHLLKKPKVEIEQRTKVNEEKESVAKPTAMGTPRLDIKKRKRVSLDDLKVKFRQRQLGEKAPLYEAEQKRDITVIYWNIDHPFYLDFIAPNSYKPNVLNPVCFLIYSLANAELISSPESDSLEIIDNIRWIVGRNLAILLR